MNKFRIVICLVLLLAGAAAPDTQPRPLRIHFIDVGQGDAVFIQEPSGQHVVYDGGADSSKVQDYLSRQGIDIDVGIVVASHNDSEHIGGLPDLVRVYRPRLFIDNGIPTTSVAYTRLRSAVAIAGAQHVAPNEQRLTVGNTSLQVVPPPRIPAWGQKDNSVGLLVEYGAFRLLLAGDAEARQWSWWTTLLPHLLRPVHVHKSSNHGAATGDTDPALARLSPEVVVVSAGRENVHAYPHAAALELYARHGARVHRTDVSGTIVIEAQWSGAYTISGTASSTPVWSLSGTVRDANSGAPLSGATALVTDGPNAGRSTISDASGGYQLTDLQQSGFTIRFTRSGYNAAAHGVTLTRSIQLDVGLRRAAPIVPSWRLSGRVRDATSGAALGNVAVLVNDGPNANRSTTTDATGHYTLANLQQSGFTVRFTRTGYNPVSRGVTLTRDTQLDVALTPTPSPDVVQPPRETITVIEPGGSGTTVCRTRAGAEGQWIPLRKNRSWIGPSGAVDITAEPTSPGGTITLRWWVVGRYGTLVAQGCNATYVGPDALARASQTYVQILASKDGDPRSMWSLQPIFDGRGFVRISLHDNRNLPAPCNDATVRVQLGSRFGGIVRLTLQGVGDWRPAGAPGIFVLPVGVRRGTYQLTLWSTRERPYQRSITVGCPNTFVYLN